VEKQLDIAREAGRPGWLPCTPLGYKEIEWFDSVFKEASSMTEASYTVKGMTCAHCVASVTEEVGELSGVRNVDVDLATGRVTIASDEPIPADQVAAAVTEAGYELVG
jgi:copper chaperone